MTFCGIGHEQIGSCAKRPPKCIICTSPYKVEEHCYRVVGCNIRKEKICIHVIAKFANLGENYTASSLRCVSRHKADMKAKKEKKTEEKRGEKNAGR